MIRGVLHQACFHPFFLILSSFVMHRVHLRKEREKWMTHEEGVAVRRAREMRLECQIG